MTSPDQWPREYTPPGQTSDTEFRTAAALERIAAALEALLAQLDNRTVNRGPNA